MTAVSTLDQLDWATTCLDQEPGCESRHGCDRAATWIFAKTCGCAVLLCDGHKRNCAEWDSTRLPTRTRCPRCGVKRWAEVPSDVGWWYPL